jgi:hypothetical protein
LGNNLEQSKNKTGIKELPSIMASKIKAMVSINTLANDLKLLKKGNSVKEPTIFYINSD